MDLSAEGLGLPFASHEEIKGSQLLETLLPDYYEYQTNSLNRANFGTIHKPVGSFRGTGPQPYGYSTL